MIGECENIEKDGIRSLYLDLLKKCLTGLLYAESAERVNLLGLPFEEGARIEGRDWPFAAHTMVGIKRLDNLHYCIEDILRNNVPGDLIETGVWRGGTTIFMRAVLKAYGIMNRCVWVADSFEGLPPPNADAYPLDAGDRLHEYAELAVSLAEVKSNFKRYGLLDDKVRFLKGWFRESLPTAPIDQLAVLRLDGDMYESTRDALVHLYPKVSVGGYVIVDDYGAISACRHAVHDYRHAERIDEEIHPIDWTGVYWRRSQPQANQPR